MYVICFFSRAWMERVKVGCANLAKDAFWYKDEWKFVQPKQAVSLFF